MGSLFSSFRVVDVSHTYEVVDARWMAVRTRHKFVLEAIHPNRLFLREYTWANEFGIEKRPVILSGKTQSGIASHRIQGPVIIGEQGSRIAVIDLGRTVDPGERETVEIEHFFVRVDPGADGFVGELAKDGCNSVELTAILPKCDSPQPLFKGKPGNSAEWSTVEPLSYDMHESGRIRIHKRISDPEPLWRYRIAWDQPIMY